MQRTKLTLRDDTKSIGEALLDPPVIDRASPIFTESINKDLQVFPYLQLFWKNRRVLWKAALCALIASILVAFLIPTRYQSITRLMPPDDQSDSRLGMLAALTSNTAGGLAGLAGDVLGMKSSGDLFIGILSSDTIRDDEIKQFQLMKIYRDSKIEDARKDLADHTEISADKKSGIISIGVTDHDPERAEAMAQAYVTQLDSLVAQLSTSSARRERLFLEDRLQKVKSDLDAAEQNFSQFASKNAAIDIPAQGKAMVDAAAALQGQLIVAQADLSGLQQIYTENNVRVRSAEAHVQELQKKLNELGGSESQGDLAKENSLYPSIRKLPLLGVTYADLYRETKIQETVYELLTQQYELAKVQEAKEIPTVKVLDPAQLPTKKSFPPRPAIVLLGTMIGIALAMLWVAGKTHWDGVPNDDPRKVFTVEVLTTTQAALPHFARNGSRAGVVMNGERSARTVAEKANDKIERIISDGDDS